MSGARSGPGAKTETGAIGRRRARASFTLDEVARGASAEALGRPAGELLEAMPWAGPSPDPDVLDAATFLAWL